MANLTITIPDAVLSRVLDAFAAQYGHTPADGTKAQFARRQLATHIRGVVQAYEVQKSSEAAAQAAADAATAFDGIQ